MTSRFLLLRPSFTKKQAFRKFTEFFSTMCIYAPNVFNVLYCKFRLVRLCPVFIDLVTYGMVVLFSRGLVSYGMLVLFSRGLVSYGMVVLYSKGLVHMVC